MKFTPERIAQLRDPRFPKDSALSDDIKHLLGECRAAADEIEQERASLSAMVQQNGDLRAELFRITAERDEAVKHAENRFWHDGEPPKPQRTEWFIAQTIYGDKVVLKALPEEFTYDYETADDTYMMARNIKRWMRFPDSEFIEPEEK